MIQRERERDVLVDETDKELVTMWREGPSYG